MVRPYFLKQDKLASTGREFPKPLRHLSFLREQYCNNSEPNVVYTSVIPAIRRLRQENNKFRSVQNKRKWNFLNLPRIPKELILQGSLEWSLTQAKHQVSIIFLFWRHPCGPGWSCIHCVVVSDLYIHALACICLNSPATCTNKIFKINI